MKNRSVFQSVSPRVYFVENRRKKNNGKSVSIYQYFTRISQHNYRAPILPSIRALASWGLAYSCSTESLARSLCLNCLLDLKVSLACWQDLWCIMVHITPTLEDHQFKIKLCSLPLAVGMDHTNIHPPQQLFSIVFWKHRIRCRIASSPVENIFLLHIQTNCYACLSDHPSPFWLLNYKVLDSHTTTIFPLIKISRLASNLNLSLPFNKEKQECSICSWTFCTLDSLDAPSGSHG